MNQSIMTRVAVDAHSLPLHGQLSFFIERIWCFRKKYARSHKFIIVLMLCQLTQASQFHTVCVTNFDCDFLTPLSILMALNVLTFRNPCLQLLKRMLPFTGQEGRFHHKLIPYSGLVAEDRKGFSAPTMVSSSPGGLTEEWMSKKKDVLMWNSRQSWKHKVRTSTKTTVSQFWFTVLQTIFINFHIGRKSSTKVSLSQVSLRQGSEI